ncbi:ATPase [Bacillaceae bacterium ZC4]|uniref:ABC-ATPase domain-containing protein n=1 Tax=Aeribacillus TaxID=1055323 RepID=UPI0007B475E6|nr:MULTISPECIES: ABC-ATPase domain-containing protein [Aeribacillus]AXI39631.1 ATPase [Bacillaceae bacterium ZC4]KZM57733.1 ATPase [Aeribacillus pallidus]MED0649421.1 ABC-ATPase domain-containing protein [Aeribacillus composti]MED0703661.1 ABC-ATPase domain-containing protein [Aeribacillus composti]MED0716349.1 ABC-ATPase domain-containing protein [Aeribacillus composti]
MINLAKKLEQIDGKGYKAYKQIQGSYKFPDFELLIDYVQGDPFASPSKIRILIARSKTAFLQKWTNSRQRKIRCEDMIVREVFQAISNLKNNVRGSGKSGLIMIDKPGQKVLERTAVQIGENDITVCLSIGLPAKGRTILGKEAKKIFFQLLPEILRHSVFSVKGKDIEGAIQLCDQQMAIRSYMKERGIIAFIANNSILPRASGVSDQPLKGAVPFQSPKEMEVSIPVPHRQEPLKGMAIYKGITLIVGGGYHGKSTLLKALEHGVYDHIEGDGREFVLTDRSACKIRAEDGRSIKKVDISAFINNLPFQKSTKSFSTENASGSTSQAANIMEMLEAGAKTLLIDEDTSATNFMIRDARMQALIHKEHEPITPFIDKVLQLKHDFDVSTILVMGGSGDYFSVADRVIKMDHYKPYDVTHEAKQIACQIKTGRKHEGGEKFGEWKLRIPESGSLNSRKGKKSKIACRLSEIQYGLEKIDLSYVEQLVDESQTRMIGEILSYIERTNLFDRRLTVSQLLDFVENKINQDGLQSFSVHYGHQGELAYVRRFELAAALNRIRALKIRE